MRSKTCARPEPPRRSRPAPRSISQSAVPDSCRSAGVRVRRTSSTGAKAETTSETGATTARASPGVLPAGLHRKRIFAHGNRDGEFPAQGTHRHHGVVEPFVLSGCAGGSHPVGRESHVGDIANRCRRRLVSASRTGWLPSSNSWRRRRRSRTSSSPISPATCSFSETSGHVAGLIGELDVRLRRRLLHEFEEGSQPVREALTNLAAASIRDIADVRLSANWMAAAGAPGEDERLYDTVVAVSALCRELSIAIPVGKGSLSMQTRWEDAGGSACRCGARLACSLGLCPRGRRAAHPHSRAPAGVGHGALADRSRCRAGSPGRLRPGAGL